MKNAFLIIVILISMRSLAQTYEGTIGKHPIFLEVDMDNNGDSATAFYFYKSNLQNIPLEGSHTASELILFEKFSEKEGEKELFSLTINKGEMSGTWQNNGCTLNVHLKKTTENLEAYKLANLEFVRDSITTYGKRELVWFTENKSKKSLFRLGNGFRKSQREFVNTKLDTIHTKYATTELDCDWADITVEIELVSKQYISFTEYSSIYCGGAHPSHNTLGYNFDYKNKIELDKLTDIYPNLNHFELLKKKYGNDDTDLDIECGYFTDGEALWDYYSWILTKNGVTITPSYPHAMTPCEQGFPLTYEELQQNSSKQ